MAFFLLPHSKKQSAVNLFSNFKFFEELPFGELNPLREKLFSCLEIDLRNIAPVWRRYKGKFWEELSLWALPSKILREVESKAFVLSPLMGIVSVGSPIPLYKADWKDTCAGVKLSDFWKGPLKKTISEFMEDVPVFDFLSSRERFFLPYSLRRVVFFYLRKGSRVKNDLPHRAYTLRYILEKNLDIDSLHRINFLDYRVKEILEEKGIVKVILEGSGEYI